MRGRSCRIHSLGRATAAGHVANQDEACMKEASSLGKLESSVPALEVAPPAGPSTQPP